MPAIRVVLADDHDLVRTGIKAVLKAIEGVEVLGEARDGEELLALLRRARPDVVITDISMPGMDGISAIARIHEQHPGLPVLILSTYETPDFIRRAVAAGARGYVPKGSSALELEQALRSIVTSGSYFSRAVTQQLLKSTQSEPAELLTERQLEILRMMATGKSSKEIGFELDLSSKTVDAHRARIMERLGISDIASLTLYAVRTGLVTP